MDRKKKLNKKFEDMLTLSVKPFQARGEKRNMSAVLDKINNT